MLPLNLYRKTSIREQNKRNGLLEGKKTRGHIRMRWELRANWELRARRGGVGGVLS